MTIPARAKRTTLPGHATPPANEGDRRSPFTVVTRGSPFLKSFGGPGDDGDIVCFKFCQLVIASGCPGECAYCFLQTQDPYRIVPPGFDAPRYDLKGTLFDNLNGDANGKGGIVREVTRWLKQQHRPAGLILGENQDGLAFEAPYKRLLGVTPLELLVPLFADSASNPAGCTLIILSKFGYTKFAELLPCWPAPNVVLSWSLSLPSISRQYEKKVMPLFKRIQEAERHKAAGMRVRFRLDAMAPIPNWEREVDAIIGAINGVGPELLTIGAMRASNLKRLQAAAAANGRDASIFAYVHDRDPSGFKHRIDPAAQRAIFQRVRAQLDPAIPLGLCKEDATLWQDLGLPWQGCHCLAGSDDTIVTQRWAGRKSVPLQMSGD